MKNNLPDHERALWILKTRGPQPIKSIAQQLRITTEGARFHLLKLQNEELVQPESVAKGRGRPKQIWSLTKRGHNRFPDSHANMTVNLITMMREQLGEEALQKVVGANEKRVQAQYQKELEGCNTLEERLKKLAEIRSLEGYMAEYKKDEAGFIFIENHCPICAAAETCQGFCRAELNIFETVLGEEVEVKREEYIIAGARRCAYRVTRN